MNLYVTLENLVKWMAEYSLILFEVVGVVVIAVAGVCGVVNYIRRDPLTRLKLAKGMAMGLEFKLGGEILRTVVVRDLSEIMIVGAIILLRAALTFLIHWEIKNEEEDNEVNLVNKTPSEHHKG
ncbi:MAG TPA: DUF1622 domain-containing protein, partial [Candidatus Faecivivens stercoripullorum]|nr:DUF1622 domain-containing protein [Candidatus Faecivivens stercoripullorum]